MYKSPTCYRVFSFHLICCFEISCWHPYGKSNCQFHLRLFILVKLSFFRLGLLAILNGLLIFSPSTL
jgi:hypothetical protein